MFDPVFSGSLQQTRVDMFELELLFGFLFFAIHLSCSESCFCRGICIVQIWVACDGFCLF